MPNVKKTKVIVCILSLSIIVSVAMWFSCGGFLYWWFFADFTPEPIKQKNYIRAKVLYHTDHEELLRVCREKLTAYNKLFPDDSQKQIDSAVESGPGFAAGEDHLKRKTHMKILDLDPTFVNISTRYIDIEMCTGFFTISLEVFPEGVEGHGDLKLLDGLWYNDAGFDDNPNFSDYLGRLKEYDLEELKK